MKLAYGVAEAADLCQISERQMRRLISEGVIHAANMGDLRVGHCELARFGVPELPALGRGDSRNPQTITALVYASLALASFLCHRAGILSGGAA